MLNKKKVVVTAESVLNFFEQYNNYIKQGYCITDPVGFDLQIFMSVQTNFWRVELEFDPQNYINKGIDNLAWEDICILAENLDIKYTSKKIMQRDIKKALNLGD